MKVRLSKNLRRNILRGHPWVYREAIGKMPKVKMADLCEVLDAKGQPVAWAMLDPHSPLALRIINTAKKKPDWNYFTHRFAECHELRKRLLPENTNCYRLFNGEGDKLPGLVCDIFGDVASLQFDGQGASEFWSREEIALWLMDNVGCRTVIDKSRSGALKGKRVIQGELPEPEVVVEENGVRFRVNLIEGQKTGFFLDQRDNRQYVKSLSHGKSVLNLFSYTGGFSVYAGMGGAKKVASLDIAQRALDLATESWLENDLNPSQHESHCVDIYEYLTTSKDHWDIVIVDPPSMTHSEKNKKTALNKYIDIFATATQRVAPKGHLFLSSCSSHVSFSDFFEIIEEALSKSRRTGQILRISGQGPDHPFPHVCHEMRYLKFVHVALND